LLAILRSGSNVVILSSLGARAAVGSLLSAYSASKGAIEALVKPFAAALGPRGIRVNAVAPGVTNTEMSNFAKTEVGHTFVLGMQALQRIGEPADIASVVVFVASDEARRITSTTIHVDGGSKL
jgi:3-oxoacyl-[acyl-carrier protein] reductase